MNGMQHTIQKQIESAHRNASMCVENTITDGLSFIEHFNEQGFDWLTWRNGSVLEVFGVRHRYGPISQNREIIRKNAIGYCSADNIPCRPKVGYIAVMFETDFRRWWTHFTVAEFQVCFPGIEVK